MLLWLQPNAGISDKGAPNEGFTSHRSTLFCTCFGGSKARVDSMIPLQLSLLLWRPSPGHADRSRVPLGSWQDPKTQDLAIYSEHSQKCHNLSQTHKASIFLLEKLWLAAISFFSLAFLIPALWKFASVVQASQWHCWNTGCSWAIKVTLGKADTPWFSFQSRQAPWKGLQKRGRKDQ